MSLDVGSASSVLKRVPINRVDSIPIWIGNINERSIQDLEIELRLVKSWGSRERKRDDDDDDEEEEEEDAFEE